MARGLLALATTLTCLQHTKDIIHRMRLIFNSERKTTANPPPGRWGCTDICVNGPYTFSWTMMSLERTVRIVMGAITDVVSVLSFAEDLTVTVHSIFLLSLEVPGGGWPRLFQAAR